MTEMIESMDSLTTEQQELAAELVARAREEGVELTGPNGLLTGLTKQVLETALEAELTEHVGYERDDPAVTTVTTHATAPSRNRYHRHRPGGE